MSGLQLASAERVAAVLDRMARKIAATFPGGVLLVGIRRRGAPIARRLEARLRDEHGIDVECRELELKRYSDELEILHHEPELTEPDEEWELEGRDVLLVDDVLYTGRTLGRALGFVTARGAGRIRCALLCVRGGPELPIRADVVGLRCDVGEGQIVDVDMPPFEDEVGVVVRRQQETE